MMMETVMSSEMSVTNYQTKSEEFSLLFTRLQKGYFREHRKLPNLRLPAADAGHLSTL